MLLHTSPVTHTGASKHNFDTGACIYTEAFTHRSSYTQQQHTHTQMPFAHRQLFPTCRCLYTGTFTYAHRLVYTQKLVHTGSFTHRHFYTQKLLHTHTQTDTHTLWLLPRTLLRTEARTHTHTAHTKKNTQKTFHAEAFTCRCFCTQKAFARKPIYTKVPLRTDVFTQNALAHRWGHTLLRTDAWRHRRLYT